MWNYIQEGYLLEFPEESTLMYKERGTDVYCVTDGRINLDTRKSYQLEIENMARWCGCTPLIPYSEHRGR